MDIGQALAMMQYANQMQDYASQQRKQPNVDWSQIATQFTPQAEEQAYTLSPLAAQASTGPALPYGAMPTYAAPEVVADVPRATMGYMPQEASPAFAELYGAPPTPDTQQMFAYNPQAMAGVSGGMPSFEQPVPQQAQVFKMPPIPIRGAMQQPVEEPMAFSPRPPQGMTDAAPFMTMPVMPGQELAMAEQPVETPAKVEETPEQQQKRIAEEQAKAWRPGNAFEVNINNIPYVIEQYGTRPGLDRKNNPEAISIRNPQTNRVISIDPTNQYYNQIIEEFDNRISKASSSEEMKDYGHSVLVDGRWLPAKFVGDPNTGIQRMVYKDPDLGDVVYQNLSELQYDPNNPDEGNYRPPVTTTGDPMSELREAQQSRRAFLKPKLESVYGAARDVTTTAPIAEVKQNIVIQSTNPVDTGKESIPSINWGYKTQDGIISLDEAEKRGIVPSGTLASVQASEKELKNTVRQQALAMSGYQEVEPQGMRDAQLSRIEESLTAIQAELDNVDSPPTAERITELNRTKADLQSTRDRLLASTASATRGPGGTTIIEGGATQRAFTLDPNTVQGALAIMFGAGVGTPGKDEVTVQPTMDDYAALVVDSASKKFTEPVRLRTQQAYKTGVGALSSRLQQIESDAVDELGDQAYKVMDMPAKFDYFDYDSRSWQSFDGTLNEAIDNFTLADKAYKSNPNSMNKSLLLAAAKPLSGKISIEGIGTYDPSTAEQIALANAPSMMQAQPVTDYSIPGRTATVSAQAEIKAAPVDVTRDARERTDTTASVPVYPYIYVGGAVNDAGSYKKYDGSFNVYEQINTTPQNYDVQVGLRTPAKARGTAQDMVARSMLKDNGVAEGQEVQAVTQSIDKFNQEIVKPEARAARGVFAQIFYSGLEKLGYNISRANGYSGFESMLNDIYLAAQRSPEEGKNALDRFMKSNFLDNTSNSGARNARADLYRTSLVQSIIQSFRGPTADTVQGSYSGNLTAIPGKAKIQLFDQIVESGYELGRLFYEAGRNRSSFTNDNYKKITWIINPFDTTTTNQSVVTMPTVLRSETANPALINYATQQGISGGTSEGSARTLPMNSDPTLPVLLRDVSSLVGNYMQPLYDFWKKADDAIVSRARANHRENMWENATGIRTTEDRKTRFNEGSQKVVSQSSIDALILGSVFPQNRVRISRRSIGDSTPWPRLNP